MTPKEEFKKMKGKEPFVEIKKIKGKTYYIMRIYSATLGRFFDYKEHLDPKIAKMDLKELKKDHTRLLKLLKDMSLNEKAMGFEFWRGYEAGDKAASKGKKQDRLQKGKSIDFSLGYIEGFKNGSNNVRLTRGKYGPIKEMTRADQIMAMAAQQARNSKPAAKVDKSLSKEFQKLEQQLIDYDWTSTWSDDASARKKGKKQWEKLSATMKALSKKDKPLVDKLYAKHEI